MNTRSILTLSTALVLGGTLMTASAFARAEEKNMSDSWITAKTKIALFADSRVKGSDINVATTDGAVIIRGKVDTDTAKRAAEGVAKGIDGAKTMQERIAGGRAVQARGSRYQGRVDHGSRERTDGERRATEDRWHRGPDECGRGVLERGSPRPHDQCPSVLVRLAGSGVKSVKNDLTVKEKA